MYSFYYSYIYTVQYIQWCGAVLWLEPEQRPEKSLFWLGAGADLMALSVIYYISERNKSLALQLFSG